LAIIDFKTSTKYKEEYMAKPWYLQMTAYAIMVEELTGNAIEECVAIVALENGISQLFITEPSQHVEELYELRQRYRNLYGV
jgi:genome maintenance exonuclease 1